MDKDSIDAIASWAIRGLIVAGITLGGWTANRLVTTQDKISDKVDVGIGTINEHTVELKNLQQTIDRGRVARDSQFQDLKAALGDHETRIRVLERPRNP